jgi:cell division protein FtsQ
LRRLVPLVIAAIAAIAFVSLTEGGSGTRKAPPISSYLGYLLERIGLGLTQVTVTGQAMTRDSRIYDQLHLTDSRSIWLLDTKEARRRVETLPWILSASVKRIFPDRLHIEVKERRPLAVWNNGRKNNLIDATGRVLGAATAQQPQNLPVVYGHGAAPHVDSIISLVNRLPALRGRIALYEWTANRRWTLHLKSQRRVLLPASGVSLALVQLVKGPPGRRLLDLAFELLDLRIPDQPAIEQPK